MLWPYKLKLLQLTRFIVFASIIAGKSQSSDVSMDCQSLFYGSQISWTVPAVVYEISNHLDCRRLLYSLPGRKIQVQFKYNCM